MSNGFQQNLISKRPFILLFFAISLLVTFASVRYFQYKIAQIRIDKQNELTAIANLKTSEIYNWYKERRNDANSIANSPLFSQAVNDWLNDVHNIALKSKIIARLDLVFAGNSYANILLASPQGKILHSYESPAVPLNEITKTKITQAIKEKNVQFTDFYYCREHKRIHMDFISPVGNARGGRQIVLILRVAPEDFLFPLIQDWPLPSKTAETLIVRQSGDSVIFLNNLRHRADTALKLRIALTEVGIPAVQTVLGKQGIMEGRDYRNIPVLAYLTKIPATDWYMISKIDQEEIYSEIRREMNWSIVTISMMIAIIGIGMSLIYHRRQQGLYRSLYLKEKEHDVLLKEFRTTLYSIGDAVITTDRFGRVLFMNPVAEGLTGWQETEARGQNLPKVFNIINEETRNPVENPVDLVMQSGNVIGLANHTVLISKDGREIPIADSGAPIRIENNQIIGVVLVFRDQTDERATKRSLQDSENQFRSIWENSLDGMRLCDANGIIRKVNRALCDLTGLTAAQLEGQPVSVMYSPDSGPEMLAKYIKRFHDNTIVPYSEKLVNLADGRSLWLELTNSPMTINGEKLLLSIFRDVTFRKLTEEKIRESEERFHSTLDNMLEGAQIIGFDWRYIYLNKIAEKHARVSKNQLLGRKYFECWPGAEDTPLFNIMKTCLEKRVAKHLINEFVYQDGSKGWFELSIQPVKEGIFILSEDITERKKAEEQVLYQAGLLQNVSDAIIATGNDNQIRMWNRAAENIYGWKAEDVVGKKFRDVVQPEYKYHPREEVFQKIEQEGMWTGEIIHHNRSGESISILSTISTLTDATGQKTGLVSVNHDITDLKKVEDALIASERRYRLIAEHVGDIVWQLDLERCFVFVSPAVGKVLGYSVAEILGKPVADFMDADGLALMQKVIKERSSSPEKPSEPTEYRMRHKAGHWVDVEVVSSLVYDKDKNLIGFAGVTRDITERKRMTAALNQSQEQLRQTQKLEALGQLASGIAHDFNNILAIILGHAYLMKSNLSDDVKLIHSIETIEKTGQRGANLVKQLLTLARRNEPSFTQINLNELINDTAKMLSETFPKSIVFKTDINLSLPFILADGSQLHQVLVNLCVNARDAMPQGGTLCISAHCESGQMIRQRRMDMNAAKYVAISVSDTGIGMDQKTLERIFEPFFTTKGPGKGTGLGLSTVHGIIANHNGFIEVKSQPGEGTTFTVFLPAPVEDEPNKASDTEDMTGLKGGNETILVIEDEDYIVELLNSVLRRFGYQTLIAKDGIAGIETYKKEMDKIALVLSDVGLPRMTGESVLKRLRELHPQVKVILASGFLDPEQKSDLFKAGLAGFLQKPFLPALLLKTIREILDNRP